MSEFTTKGPGDYVTWQLLHDDPAERDDHSEEYLLVIDDALDRAIDAIESARSALVRRDYIRAERDIGDITHEAKMAAHYLSMI